MASSGHSSGSSPPPTLPLATSYASDPELYGGRWEQHPSPTTTLDDGLLTCDEISDDWSDAEDALEELHSFSSLWFGSSSVEKPREPSTSSSVDESTVLSRVPSSPTTSRICSARDLIRSSATGPGSTTSPTARKTPRASRTLSLSSSGTGEDDKELERISTTASRPSRRVRPTAISSRRIQARSSATTRGLTEHAASLRRSDAAVGLGLLSSLDRQGRGSRRGFIPRGRRRTGTPSE